MSRLTGFAAALLLGLGAIGSRAATYNVRDYGAKADKATDDAPAIQAAIDACNQAGGGEVIVPPGDYLVGHIALKSNVALDLQGGSTLWASSRWEDYHWDQYERSVPGRMRFAGQQGRARPRTGQRNAFLITCDDQENVTVMGTGEIHGLGEGDLDRRTDGNPGFVRMALQVPHRYGTMQFSRCRDVHIRGIRIRYSERYSISLSRCERVFIDGVSIRNNYWHTETDGIDPGSCKDVFISNCDILNGDDCIALNSGAGPVENVVITNCTLQTIATALKLGTGSRGDFRHVRVSNCVIRNTGIGIGFFIKDGGTAEDLSFDNISIETTTQDTEVGRALRISFCPIFIDIERRLGTAPIGAVRDVSFSNIQITSDYGVLIQGMTESPIQDLTLRNITLRVPRGFDFSVRRKQFGGTGNPHDDRITKYARRPTYVALGNIDGLDVEDVRVLMSDDIARQYPRSAVGVYDSRDGVVRDVELRPAAHSGGPPAVALDNCQGVRVISNP